MVSLSDTIIFSPHFYASFIPPEYIEEKTLQQQELDFFVEDCWRVSIRVLFAKKVREYFPNAILEKRDWINSVGFEPPERFKANHPNDYVFKFDKVSCQEISAYCSVPNSQFPCTKEGGPFLCSNLYLKEAVHVCQPNCLSQENPLDTVWHPDSNKCLLTNVILKSICLNPTGGVGGSDAVEERGPPLLWDNLNSTCSISPEYCEFYGENFDSSTGTCTNPVVVNVAEFVFGKTISRTIAHPIDTFKQRNTAFDCRSQRRYKREEEAAIQTTATEINITTQLSEIVLKQTYKYTQTLKPLVRNNILLHEAIRISGKQLFKPALVLLRVFNGPVGWALLAADVIGAVSDYIDPRHLKTEMSKGDLESATRLSKQMYKKMYLDLTRRDRADSFFDNINRSREGGRRRKRHRKGRGDGVTVEDVENNDDLLELLIDQYMTINSDKFIPKEELEPILNEYISAAGANLNDSTRQDYIMEFLNTQNDQRLNRTEKIFQNIKKNWTFYGIIFLFAYLTFKMVKGSYILINDIWSVVIIFTCTLIYMLQAISHKSRPLLQ